MKIICKGRRDGKTTDIINIIKKDETAVMIVPVEMMKQRLRDQYHELRKQIHTWHEFESKIALRGYGFTSAHIDDLEMILAHKSGNDINVETISLTKR